MEKIQVPTFVKWAGGKTKSLARFERFIPKDIDRYFEPFLGGGSVFFYVKQKFNPNKCYISDRGHLLSDNYCDR